MSDKLAALNASASRANNGMSVGQPVFPCQWRLRVRVKSIVDWWPTGPVTVNLDTGSSASQSQITRMQSKTSAEVVFVGKGSDQFQVAAESGSWILVSAQSGSLTNGKEMLVELEITSAKTWVAIQLVDLANQPVPNQRYRLRLPGGQIKEGKLDRQGSARVEDIQEGECSVSFPDLDEEAWKSLP